MKNPGRCVYLDELINNTAESHNNKTRLQFLSKKYSEGAIIFYREGEPSLGPLKRGVRDSGLPALKFDAPPFSTAPPCRK